MTDPRPAITLDTGKDTYNAFISYKRTFDGAVARQETKLPFELCREAYLLQTFSGLDEGDRGAPINQPQRVL